MKKIINIYCLGKYGYPTFEEAVKSIYGGASKEELKYYGDKLKNEIIETLKENGFIKEAL